MTTRKAKSGTPGAGRPRKPPPPPASARLERRARTAQLAEIPQTEMTPRVRSAVTTLMQELDRLKQQLSAANARMSELENMADEDPLLPVLNRRGFLRELERTLAYARRYRTTLSLVYADLDDFKAINDRHGHAAGDAALRYLAAILLDNVRSSDLVGRLGGDEFAIVLQQADKAQAEAKAARLCERVAAAPFSHDGAAIALGLTAGVAQLREDDTVESLFERADRAMYALKAARRKRA